MLLPRIKYFVIMSRLNKTVEEFDRRGFTASRRPYEGHALSLPDFEADVVHRLVPSG